MSGTSAGNVAAWAKRTSERRNEIMTKIRRKSATPEARAAMARFRTNWWANRQRCFHCGGRSHAMIPVEGLPGEVECRAVKRCEQRILASWKSA